MNYFFKYKIFKLHSVFWREFVYNMLWSKKKSTLGAFFLPFSCFIFCFLASRDYERLNYLLLGAWIPNTLWCNALYYPFNVISILLFSFLVYCFVYSLIIHLHVCYRVLITEKCFYPMNLKEFLSNSCLGIK